MTAVRVRSDCPAATVHASAFGFLPQHFEAHPGLLVLRLPLLQLGKQRRGLVVGLPLSLDGSFGPAAQAAKDWAAAMSEATGLPAALWDERLSTAAAARLLTEGADLSRRRRTDAVDSVAAAWTLQAALDASA
jgi:RNase H-fold protein (predicted Holliday junction resolvase)